MSIKRLFLAVPAEKSWIQQNEKALESWKACATTCEMRWIPDRNLHITLQFIGDVQIPKIPSLIEAVSPAVEGIPQQQVDFSQILWLPSTEKASVLTAGYHAGNLREVPRHLREKLKPFFKRPDFKAFKAHVTLARSSRPVIIPESLVVDPLTTFPVKEIVLFESRMYQYGAEYFPLKSWKLGE